MVQVKPEQEVKSYSRQFKLKKGFAKILRRYGKRVAVLEELIPGVNHYPTYVYKLRGKYYIVVCHVSASWDAPDWDLYSRWEVKSVKGPFNSIEEAENWFYKEAYK